jgi:integrase
MAMIKTQTPGIYQVRGKKGKVKYQLMTYVQVSDPLSTSGFKWKPKGIRFASYREAVDAKIKIQAEIKSGQYIEPKDATVKELMAAWLKAGETRGVTRHGRWKIQTHLSHERQYNDIVPKLGEIKASKLRKSQIEQAAAEWKEAKSSEVANVLLSALGAAFKWALRDPDRFGVRMNPLDTVERFAREERPEEVDGELIADYGEDQLRAKPGRLRAVGPHEVLSKLELRKIIEAAAPGMERSMLMVAILCGLRHGEIAGVRWSVIDFKRRTLTVNRSLTQLSKKRGGPRLEMPKNKKSVREIELPAPLVTELRQWKLACPPNDLDLVFVNSRGRPTCRQDKRDRLKAACKRAGVRPVTMHNLRHSYASQQLLNGTDPVEVSGLMGHSSPMTTLTIYAHWIRKEKSRAQERLANGIMEAVEEVSEEAHTQNV